jgi:hypothetical protein
MFSALCRFCVYSLCLWLFKTTTKKLNPIHFFCVSSLCPPPLPTLRNRCHGPPSPTLVNVNTHTHTWYRIADVVLLFFFSQKKFPRQNGVFYLHRGIVTLANGAMWVVDGHNHRLCMYR